MIATAVRLALHGATADSPLNQISCESDEYIAFEVLGFIGVMAVPVGIPTLSLLLLLKNRDGIREGPGNPSFDSFEFLVADYKPAFFYWDTVEMLRKVRGST